MNNTNEDIKIYGKLVNVSTEGIVADTTSIWSDMHQKNVEEVISDQDSKNAFFDENLAKLNDTVYPITLVLSLATNVSTMQTDIRYSITSDGKPLVPDTLLISKQINDSSPNTLLNISASSGSLSTPIQGAREIFKFEVGKNGRTGKSTSQTRYICYYGGNQAATMTAEILNTLNKVSATGVSFNPKVTTNDNDYIWIVVPSYLSISRVTSAGFDVTLATPQTITNSLGSFKAYRTANPLTQSTWNLIIS